MSEQFLSPCWMSLWTVSYNLLHIHIWYDTYLCEVACRVMSSTRWSSVGSSCAFLLPWRYFVRQMPTLLHLEEICDGRLPAFSLPFEPVAPPCGHLQVLIHRPRWATPWWTLAWWGWRPPLALCQCHCWNCAAAVKCWHVLAPELLPLYAGALSWHLTLEIKVPALVGHFHAHAEQLLEFLLQLLVIHRPKKVPPHRPHFQSQGLNAS